MIETKAQGQQNSETEFGSKDWSQYTSNRRTYRWVANGIACAVLGLCLHTFLGLADRWANWPQYAAARTFYAVPQEERLELRSDWMPFQTALAFRNKALIETGSWRDYRVIHFTNENRYLVCAPDNGPIPTGFTYWGWRGFDTAMPRDTSTVFEVLLLCSIRI